MTELNLPASQEQTTPGSARQSYGNERERRLALATWPSTRTVLGDYKRTVGMIDRVVHHAEVIPSKGSGYRLRNAGIETLRSIRVNERSG